MLEVAIGGKLKMNLENVASFASFEIKDITE